MDVKLYFKFHSNICIGPRDIEENVKFGDLKMGSNYVKSTVKINGLCMLCCLMIFNTNIKFQSDIGNSSRDIEENVNIRHF